MLKRWRHVTGRLVSASLLLICASPAWAQATEQVQDAPEGKPWVALVLAIFLGFAVCIGCFMTPRRTHQD